MSNPSDSSMDRSRSDRGVLVSATQAGADQRSSTISVSSSSPDTRIVQQRPTAPNTVQSPAQSPETLSQFIRSVDQSPQHEIPPNPFGGQPSTEGNTTFVQHTVHNELHVSMDPFILTQANEAIERSRNDLRSEALQFVEQNVSRVQAEANQFANMVHQEASRVVGESQAQASQSQSLLEESRVETSDSSIGIPRN